MKAAERKTLLATLQARFARNMARHKDIAWEQVQAKLEAAAAGKLDSLGRMEASGGEPDVIGLDRRSGELLLADCAAESPTGRRSLCYDGAALDARKEAKPAGSALGMAADMGIELLSEAQYRDLQKSGPYDTKTSSWILTPPAIRKLGGALFCDCRYGQVFTYHNGAQSYYAARGFRGLLRI